MVLKTRRLGQPRGNDSKSHGFRPPSFFRQKRKLEYGYEV